jgi:hypothetical protein
LRTWSIMTKNSSPTPASRVTGVLLCRDRVAVYTGGKGPDAVRAMHGAASVFAEGELQGLLSSAIAEGILSNKVAIGVDPLLEFFSTQRTISFQEGGKAESLIDELRGKYEGRLVAESLKTSLSPKTHQTAIAVPSGELSEATAAFAGFEGSARFISTTHAVYAMAAAEDPAPRRWKSDIRVFLGSREGLILFAVDGALVARQIFEYSGQAQGAVITAVNGMVAAVQEGLALDQPSGVIFHVGGDNNGLAELCTDITGIEAISRSSIAYDQATLGNALSFEGFRRRRLEIDFLEQESVKQEKKRREKKPSDLPMKPMAGMAAAMLAMGGYLWNAGSEVQTQIDGLHAEADATLALFDYDAFQLSEALSEMRKTASVGEGFLMNRVYWADFLHELPGIIPPTVDLVALTADYQFIVPDDEEEEDDDGEKKPTRSIDENARFFEIELKAPLAGIGSSIPELTQITAGLAASDNFNRYFREIPAPDINPMEVDGVWQANIVLRCTP